MAIHVFRFHADIYQILTLCLMMAVLSQRTSAVKASHDAEISHHRSNKSNLIVPNSKDSEVTVLLRTDSIEEHIPVGHEGVLKEEVESHVLSQTNTHADVQDVPKNNDSSTTDNKSKDNAANDTETKQLIREHLLDSSSKFQPPLPRFQPPPPHNYPPPPPNGFQSDFPPPPPPNDFPPLPPPNHFQPPPPASKHDFPPPPPSNAFQAPHPPPQPHFPPPPPPGSLRAPPPPPPNGFQSDFPPPPNNLPLPPPPDFPPPPPSNAFQAPHPPPQPNFPPPPPPGSFQAPPPPPPNFPPPPNDDNFDPPPPQPDFEPPPPPYDFPPPPYFPPPPPPGDFRAMMEILGGGGGGGGNKTRGYCPSFCAADYTWFPAKNCQPLCCYTQKKRLHCCKEPHLAIDGSQLEEDYQCPSDIVKWWNEWWPVVLGVVLSIAMVALVSSVGVCIYQVSKDRQRPRRHHRTHSVHSTHSYQSDCSVCRGTREIQMEVLDETASEDIPSQVDAGESHFHESGQHEHHLEGCHEHSQDGCHEHGRERRHEHSREGHHDHSHECRHDETNGACRHPRTRRTIFVVTSGNNRRHNRPNQHQLKMTEPPPYEEVEPPPAYEP